MTILNIYIALEAISDRKKREDKKIIQMVTYGISLGINVAFGAQVDFDQIWGDNEGEKEPSSQPKAVSEEMIKHFQTIAEAKLEKRGFKKWQN